MQKNLRRIFPIILNGIRSILSPLISIVFSYLIVHYHSKEIWGGFVDYLLFFYMASLISNWGSKDHLLRSFSEKPAQVILHWQAFFISRLPILALILIVTPFFFGLTASGYLMIWIIANYISNAFTPVFIFKRDYGKIIFIELIGFATLLLQWAFHEGTLTISDLVFFFTIQHVTKALLYLLNYYTFIQFKRFNFQLSLLAASTPFFLMSLTGFLQSKVDLYAFGFFNNDSSLGEYQIISGFFIFSQSIATIIILPYIKNIYRMKNESITRLKWRIAFIGAFINTVVVTVIYYALFTFFKIELSLLELVFGFLIGFPSYLYILHILNLFKNNREKRVLTISFLSLLVNLILSLVLLSLSFSTIGALIANGLSQLFVLYFYLREKIDDEILKKIK